MKTLKSCKVFEKFQETLLTKQQLQKKITYKWGNQLIKGVIS